MNEHDIVREWLKIAFDDYDSAQYLYDNKDPKPLEIICYHCQQSVEKSLKAYICANDIEVPETQELSLLRRLCVEIDESFSNFSEDLSELESYSMLAQEPNEMQIEDYNAQRAL